MKNCTKLALVLLALALHGCGNEGGQELGNETTKPTTKAAPTEKLVVKDWAPKETEQGVVFNQQPNGKSALWVLIDGVHDHPDTKIFFDGKPMEDIAVTDKAVTGAAPLSYISTPGPKEISIEEGGTGRRIVVGTFMVKNKTK